MAQGMENENQRIGLLLLTGGTLLLMPLFIPLPVLLGLLLIVEFWFGISVVGPFRFRFAPSASRFPLFNGPLFNGLLILDDGELIPPFRLFNGSLVGLILLDVLLLSLIRNEVLSEPGTLDTFEFVVPWTLDDAFAFGFNTDLLLLVVLLMLLTLVPEVWAKAPPANALDTTAATIISLRIIISFIYQYL